jgi:glycerol-3-phosphate cytidylyltransferase
MSQNMKRIGYVSGAFDLFHVGHLNILKNAKSRCDYLIAGVVSDEMLKINKGLTPVIPLAERLEIVRNIQFVDEARIEAIPSKLDVWRELKFDVFFKGDDWANTDKGRALEQGFSGVGVEMVYLPYSVTTSSSALRKAIESVNRMADRSGYVQGDG